MAHIARDPLDPAFDDRRFRAALARKDSAIKRVLLGQTTISGVGNIYADEALWAARLHPESPARELPTRAVNRLLLAEIRAVLEKALAEGGCRDGPFEEPGSGVTERCFQSLVFGLSCPTVPARHRR